MTGGSKTTILKLFNYLINVFALFGCGYEFEVRTQYVLMHLKSISNPWLLSQLTSQSVPQPYGASSVFGLASLVELLFYLLTYSFLESYSSKYKINKKVFQTHTHS